MRTMEEIAKLVAQRQSEAKEAVNNFILGATNGNMHLFSSGLDGLGKRGAWVAGFRKLVRTGGVHPNIKDKFADIWVMWGDSLRNEINDDLLLIDAMRLLLAPYEGPAVTVYRGDSAHNRRRRTYGISWSSSLDVARDFAVSGCRYYDGGSVLIKALAPADAIVYAPALRVRPESLVGIAKPSKHEPN